METIKKVTIHRLNELFVEIETDQYVEVNGQEIKLDIPKNSGAYSNSESGREIVKSLDLPKNIVKAIFEVWGKTPLIEDLDIRQFNP